MKYLTTILIMLFTLGMTQASNARDDFGGFFTGEAPNALEGSPQDILSDILAIEPAAGDEDADTETDESLDEGESVQDESNNNNEGDEDESP